MPLGCGDFGEPAKPERVELGLGVSVAAEAADVTLRAELAVGVRTGE